MTLFFEGIGGLGKSTVLKAMNPFWAPHKRAILSSNMQPQFGMSSLVHGDVAFWTEVAADLNLPQEEWQDATGGAMLNLAIKHKEPSSAVEGAVAVGRQRLPPLAQLRAGRRNAQPAGEPARRQHPRGHQGQGRRRAALRACLPPRAALCGDGPHVQARRCRRPFATFTAAAAASPTRWRWFRPAPTWSPGPGCCSSTFGDVLPALPRRPRPGGRRRRALGARPVQDALPGARRFRGAHGQRDHRRADVQQRRRRGAGGRQGAWRAHSLPTRARTRTTRGRVETRIWPRHRGRRRAAARIPRGRRRRRRPGAKEAAEGEVQRARAPGSPRRRPRRRAAGRGAGIRAMERAAASRAPRAAAERARRGGGTAPRSASSMRQAERRAHPAARPPSIE